jgi:hypothetical protein
LEEKFQSEEVPKLIGAAENANAWGYKMSVPISQHGVWDAYTYFVVQGYGIGIRKEMLEDMEFISQDPVLTWDPDRRN